MPETIFEGDVLFTETEDGGDMSINNGLIVSDTNLATAVYLSLFGGNKDDSGKVKNNKTWWGNTLQGISENEKLVSRFQQVITGLLLSIKNVKEAENAAYMDLKWIIDEGIADDIIIEGKTTGKDTFYLSIHILKDRNSLFEGGYATLWRSMSGGI